MKHKYRKTVFIFEYLFIALLLFLFLLFLYFVAPNEKAFKKSLFGGIIFYIGLLSIFGKDYFSRSVEFFESYVRFNSFRFKGIRNVISLNVKYEDFLSLESKSIPIIGIYGIKISARNIPHPIVVSFCFSKHKEMFKKMYILTKQNNPNIFVDEPIINYLGSERNE